MIMPRILVATIALLTPSLFAQQQTDRITASRQLCETLYNSASLPGSESDPELMQIVQRFTYGDVPADASLNPAVRELIACTVLVYLQQMPQLRLHAEAALRAGATPIQLREAIYQCTPFLGYPRVLPAVKALNEVLRDKGIKLPLESQGTTTEENRYERGLAIQKPLYGDEIAQNLAGVPGGAGQRVARFLTEYCFGDFYTREGLSPQDREMLIYALLIAMEAENQLPPHTLGNIKLGLSRETLAAIAVQCLPYVGFPPVMKALKVIQESTPRPAPVPAAPASVPQPLVRLSKIEVSPEQLAAYNVLLKEEIEASMRLEPGVLTLYATAEKERPHVVTILEIYASEEAYRSHLQTPHFQKYKQGTLDMVQKLELVDSTALIPNLTIKKHTP